MTTARRRPAARTRTLLLAAALAATALSGGCRPRAPATPADDPSLRDQAADALLTEKVRAKLLTKLGTDALGIDIVTRGDRVLLTGAVDERPTQELAEEVTRSVTGVRKVDNRIAMVPRTGGPGPVGRAAASAESELGDAALESRVKADLLGELGRYALEIEVEATDGVVSLRGWVPDAGRERIALDTARGVRGVAKVIDLIRIGLEE